MHFLLRVRAITSLNSFRRGFLALMALACLSLTASGQTIVDCTNTVSTPTQVASTGLAELLGTITITCTGGTAGNTVFANLYVTLNTNITNTLDSNGNPTGITIGVQGPTTVTEDTTILSSPTSLEIPNLTYSVPTPNTLPVTITINGIRASAASVQNGQAGTVINATLIGLGMILPTYQLPLGIGNPPLAASSQNNGIPCSEPALPSSTDFDSFVNGGVASSSVRVTETTPAAFVPAATGATNGTRILVRLSGYGSNVQLWVPNALVGNSGSVPTSAGAFASSIAGGTYTHNANQLLLSLVTGADQNGVGGTLVTTTPGGGASFTGLTQISVSNGSAYAVYEVLDDSPYVQESVQVPVFIVTSNTNCSLPLTPVLSVVEAPVSTVSVATATDPVPRYINYALAPDCQQTGDCNQGYFPVLSLDTTPITLTGSAQGLTETATVALLNNGGSLLTYSTSIAYQSGANWLSVTPASGDVMAGLPLQVIGDPTTLQPGTYSATVTVNAGEAGSSMIPVTFNVGPAGPTVRAIVNAASFQSGVTPGSYVALFGADLAGTNVTVTFNGIPVTPIYDSAGQVNLIVPSSLAPQSGVPVIATINGTPSNTFKLTLLTNAPGIFTPGILNADSSINSASNPAARGSFVQIYLTGMTIPLIGTLSVTMGSQIGIAPLPGQTYATVLPALNQVNVTVPGSLAFSGNSTPLSVCIAALAGVDPLCSNSVALYVK